MCCFRCAERAKESVESKLDKLHARYKLCLSFSNVGGNSVYIAGCESAALLREQD